MWVFIFLIVSCVLGSLLLHFARWTSVVSLWTHRIVLWSSKAVSMKPNVCTQCTRHTSAHNIIHMLWVKNSIVCLWVFFLTWHNIYIPSIPHVHDHLKHCNKHRIFVFILSALGHHYWFGRVEVEFGCFLSFFLASFSLLFFLSVFK